MRISPRIHTRIIHARTYRWSDNKTISRGALSRAPAAAPISVGSRNTRVYVYTRTRLYIYTRGQTRERRSCWRATWYAPVWRQDDAPLLLLRLAVVPLSLSVCPASLRCSRSLRSLFLDRNEVLYKEEKVAALLFFFFFLPSPTIVTCAKASAFAFSR